MAYTQQQGNKAPSIQQRGNVVFLHADNEWYAYDFTNRPLGSGAMGTVYRGWRVRDKRPVAIKQVTPKYANIPSIRQRARLEASMQFSHPNLVEMLGCCELSPNNGPMFIISEFVRGITLDEHIKVHKLRAKPDATQRICETIYPVLDALNYLHSKEIIHLDVKPSNIMLENDYKIRLMDLGIAYTHDAVKITSPGILGTPQYAAPEQVLKQGDTHLDIDPTTDLYELGVTLYELLSGSNPFYAQTIEQTIIKQRTEILPPIDGVSKYVMAVIHKATSKKKEDRYQSATEFKQALQEALKPHPNIFKRFLDWLFG